MPYYRLAGHSCFFQYHLLGLSCFKVPGEAALEIETLHPHSNFTLLARENSFIGEENRQVEVWSAPPGILLKVSGGSDFYIASDHRAVMRVGEIQGSLPPGKLQPSSVLSVLDREILLGPALVLTLALRGTWSLHASAATYQDRTLAFVGESGRGKSTLAASLSDCGWRLVADDILPVTALPQPLTAWPHFPQLKLPIDRQPGASLPEHLPLNIVCELVPVRPDERPEITRLLPGQAVRVLLRHVAGTRLFHEALLAKYLDFCARAAEQLQVYQLTYPHRKEALPEIGKLLETLC